MSQSRMNPDTQINPEIIGDQVLILAQHAWPRLAPDFAIDLFTSYQREYPHLAFLVQRQPLQQVQQVQQEEEDLDEDFSSSYGTVTTVDLSSAAPSAESSSALNSGDNVISPPRSLSPTPRILWYSSSMYGRTTLTDALLELRAYCVRMMRIRVWIDSVDAAMAREVQDTTPPFMANGPNVPQQEEAHDSNVMETETGNGAKREHDQTDGESDGPTPQIKKEKLQ